MSENSKIEWTGHQLGAMKVAAKRIGICFEAYIENIVAGRRWCHACQSFHEKPEFGIDRTRGDGLARLCLKAKAKRCRTSYRPVARARGRKFVAPRDGDKAQARGRVNYMVRVALLPDPNSLRCVDCWHIGTDYRHEYDHYLGYAAEHHEQVEAVCARCHFARSEARGELVQTRGEDGVFIKANHG
jgi:hypothetical protein